MPERQFLAVLMPVALFACLAQPSLAQDESSRPFSTLGVGIKVSLLGAGAEAATPLTRRSNLRVGVNGFAYDRSFHKDGVSYAARLGFRSAEVHYDWFPSGGGFHLSPGALVYNGNEVKANASVPGGQTFTLNGTTYSSDPATPVTGRGKISFNTAGPMFTLGWGNLVPRRHRFSVPFEIGAIYTGAPQTVLGLTGKACDSTGANCRSISSDAAIQSNVAAEKNKLDKDMASFKFYPVISLGFGFKF